jgi:Dyp-type peroxidase family
MGSARLGDTGVTDVVQADLQGNILCGYGRRYPHGLFLLLRVEDRIRALSWLEHQVSQVTSALPWNEPPAATLNVAFSFSGLRALGVPDGVLAEFPEEFRQGMAARFTRLGDTGASHPDRWMAQLRQIDLLVTVSAQDAAVRDARSEALRAEAPAAGLAVACLLATDVPSSEEEPFGFRDGLSQPAILDPRAGPWRRTSSDPPVAPGEFVLGYEDEGGTVAQAPPRLGFNGSYMVVRRLEQDVEGFSGFLAAEAGPDEERQEWLAAKIVGRWRDGTPLALCPDAPSPDRHGDLGWLNDFSYAFDSDGFACPIGAHIRRTNPRDSLDRDWRFSNRHRIIRRGMPYATNGDAGERGLMFACYQASIERQFEFVQSQWCVDGNALGLGSDPDFIAGGPEGKMTIQGRPPRFVPMRSFVTNRGGEYLFAPGIGGLRYITQARR